MHKRCYDAVCVAYRLPQMSIMLIELRASYNEMNKIIKQFVCQRRHMRVYREGQPGDDRFTPRQGANISESVEL